VEIKTFTRCPGLVTAPNSESAGPGALRQAVNVVMRRADLIEKRRPLRQYTQTTSFASSVRASAAFGYNKRLFILDNNATQRWYLDDGTNTATLTQLTPLPAGIGSVIFFSQVTTAEMNGSVFIPFAGQLLKIDSISSAVPYLAGLPRPLYTQISAFTILVAGWFLASASVAYRAIFGFQDANGTLVLSPPSQRYVSVNAGAAANPTVKVGIPTEITASAKLTSIFIQLYRTNIQAAGGDPGDEMGLVYQKFLTSTDASNGYVTIPDVFPEGVNKGPALYTNASQQGIANANTQPPLCTDIASFKNAMFYSNTTSKQRISTTLIGFPEWNIASIAANTPIAGQATYTFSGSPDLTGIDNTFTLAVNGTVGALNDNFGGWAIISVNVGAFQIVVNGAGVAQAGGGGTAISGKLTIAGTTNSLLYTNILGSTAVGLLIPRPSVGTFAQRLASAAASFAFSFTTGTTTLLSVSGPDDPPGVFLIEELGIGGSPFTLSAAGGAFQACFAPALFTAQTSGNDKAINRVYYSKFAQPEHVPLANYFDIGGRTAAVLRIVPLRDSLFVFKEDGIFRITGDGISWNVARFDDTLVLVHANAIAVVFNTIYALTTKGLVAITDNGIRIISEPVANLIRNFTDGPTLPTVYSSAAEKDGLVYFSLYSGAARLGICYSYRTNTWSTVDITSAAIMGGPGLTVGGTTYRVNSDQLYAEAAVDPTENPALGTITAGAPVSADRFRLLISSVNAGASQITATVNNSVISIAVGDLVIENIGAIGVTGLWSITNVAGSVLTLAPFLGTQGGFQFTSSLTYLYRGISSTHEYVPYTAGDDHAVKHFPAASVLLDAASTLTSVTVGMYTEIARTEIDQVTSAVNVLDLRTLVPLTMNRCRRLSLVVKHSAPGQFLFVKGVSYEVQPIQGGGRAVE